MVTWVDFKKLFFLQFFPRAEQERLKREYHSIRQTSTETSTEFMQRFLRLAGSTLNHLMCMSYTDVAQVANAARNYEILHERDDEDIERPDKRDQTGIVVVTTTAVATTITLAVTTGIPVMGVTRETGVISPTDLPILKDCKKNTTASTSGQADKKPGASGRVFVITEGHAANTS
nr:hypothetical protein [Tanacetum cinerariifolium]